MRTIVAATPLSFYIYRIHCFSSTYDKLLLFDVVALNPTELECQDTGNKLYFPYALRSFQFVETLSRMYPTVLLLSMEYIV